jgi:hypothetical protein
MFLECQTNACISLTRDYCSSLRRAEPEGAVGAEGIAGCVDSWKGGREAGGMASGKEDEPEEREFN